MTRKFLESLDQEGGDVVPAGDYTVEVVDARALEDKPFLWLDLKIVGGPDDGRVVTVGLNIPDDNSSRGAIFHFKKKIRAFSRILMDAAVFDLPDDEQPAQIADLIIGVTADVTLGVQADGQYEGSQQLDETQAPSEAPPAPPAAAQNKKVEPVTPPAAAPVAEAEETVDVEPAAVAAGDDEDELPF